MVEGVEQGVQQGVAHALICVSVAFASAFFCGKIVEKHGKMSSKCH